MRGVGKLIFPWFHIEFTMPQATMLGATSGRLRIWVSSWTWWCFGWVMSLRPLRPHLGERASKTTLNTIQVYWLKLFDNLWKLIFHVSLLFKTWICLRWFFTLYHGKSASRPAIWENMFGTFSKHLKQIQEKKWWTCTFAQSSPKWLDCWLFSKSHCELVWFSPGRKTFKPRKKLTAIYTDTVSFQMLFQLFWVATVTILRGSGYLETGYM